MNLNKLKGVIREKEKTYEACAKTLDISKTAFSNKINGASKFFVEEINVLADYLQLTNEERIEIFLTRNLHDKQEKEIT